MEKQLTLTSKNHREHKEFQVCRFCLSKNLEEVINLGNIPLAGGFFKKGTKKFRISPRKILSLKISFCKIAISYKYPHLLILTFSLKNISIFPRQ